MYNPNGTMLTETGSDDVNALSERLIAEWRQACLKEGLSSFEIEEMGEKYFYQMFKNLAAQKLAK